MIFKKVSVQDICGKEIVMVNITEKDWRLFKEKLPCWQERHMARLNDEYIKFLSGNGPASEKFWEIEKGFPFLHRKRKYKWKKEKKKKEVKV